MPACTRMLTSVHLSSSQCPCVQNRVWVPLNTSSPRFLLWLLLTSLSTHPYTLYPYVLPLLESFLFLCLLLYVPPLSKPPRWPSGKASASRGENPGFESCLRRDFYTSDFKIGTPVATTLPGAWRCRVSAGTGVSIL